MGRLTSAVGVGPRLLVKRDDAIGFAFGGNKVRKLAFLAAAAQAERADTLVTAGAIQSNHARVTAAAAAKLGMKAVLVVNGPKPSAVRANALLDSLLGAEVVYVSSPEERPAALTKVAEELRRDGRRPYEIPVGGSTPIGALGYVDAMLELVDQGVLPAVIVHATSSGGTQAGLVAACRLLRLPTRVIGVSADDRIAAIRAQIDMNIEGIARLLELEPDSVASGTSIEIDGRFVGEGYGCPTDASREAIEMTARTEAIFLDPVYTGKAMAGLLALVRERRFASDETVLFWHTGGQVALFA